MISHEHRTVFVHIPKTAGQSVETVFLDDLGLAWRDRAPLLLQHNENRRIGPPRLAHLTAREYVEHHYVSAELFESYFTFAVVRNPWERTVSMYKWVVDLDRPEAMSFADFVTRRLARRLWRNQYWWVRPQTEYICDDDDNVLVDFVGRFERLDEAFTEVSTRLGLSADRLPRVNASAERSAVAGEQAGQRASRGYADWYDGRTADAVASMYARDIAVLGYELP